MEFRNQDGDVQLPSSSSSPPPPPPPFSLIYSPPPVRGSAFSKPALHASSSLLFTKAGGGGGGARNGSANFGSSARVGNQDPAPISTLFPSSKPCSGEGGKAADEVAVKYKECLRNHAAAAGGHVLDGCGEFMPNGIDALKCAACGCHRSFHRRDSDAYADDFGSHHRGGAHLPPPLLLPPPPPHYHHHRTAAYGGGGFPSPPPLPSRVVPVSSSGVMASGGTTTESSSEERVVGGAPARKRFRTKFTADQKEKMVAFAERIGWRLQRHEEALVEQFCDEAGIQRHVLKVWMHNNKHSIKKQQEQQQQQQQQQEQQLPPQEQLQLMAQEQ